MWWLGGKKCLRSNVVVVVVIKHDVGQDDIIALSAARARMGCTRAKKPLSVELTFCARERVKNIVGILLLREKYHKIGCGCWSIFW